MLGRMLLAVLVLAVGMHHVGPLLGIGGDGHHPVPAAPAGDAGHGGGVDGIAGTCLAVLTLALVLPRMRRLLSGLAAPARTIPGLAWTNLPGTIRGPPPSGACPPFLRLCTLRR